MKHGRLPLAIAVCVAAASGSPLGTPYGAWGRPWGPGPKSSALSLSPGEKSEEMIVDADFPGGNIIVDRIEKDMVFLKPDQRDSSTWWFYWHFRVRGAAGRTLRFRFVGRSPIGTRGPAVSTDGGEKWSWLDPEAKWDSSFTYEFDKQDRDVRFCFSIPFLEADLRKFLKEHVGNQHLAVYELCRSRKGRSVERLHVGKIHGEPKYRVLLTVRHHACEMIASYSLEGLLDAVLSDTDLGRWFRNNVEILAVPFVDKDGVEGGDQGKNRKPHDHNRDYAGKSVYPSVAAIRRFVPEWSKDKLKVVLDMHCPYISGRHNEVIYLVGSSNPAIWKQQQNFGEILQSVRQGPLSYSADDNLPFGTAWNTAANYGKQKSCSRWGAELPEVLMASTIEIPYANVGKVTVTPENARAFGKDLAQALRRYLQDSD